MNKVRHFHITLLLTGGLDGGGSGTCVNVFIFAAEWKLNSCICTYRFLSDTFYTDVANDEYFDILNDN